MLILTVFEHTPHLFGIARLIFVFKYDIIRFKARGLLARLLKLRRNAVNHHADRLDVLRQAEDFPLLFAVLDDVADVARAAAQRVCRDDAGMRRNDRIHHCEHQIAFARLAQLFAQIQRRMRWAVLGGAKVADKLNVIDNLLEKVDTLIIGGGMAYTFLKAKGYGVGKSLLDETKIDYCKDMMAKAEAKGIKLLLPVDTVCIKDFPDPIDAAVETVTVDADAIPEDMEGCDIGPKSRELFAAAVKDAKTVIWNGPMGVFENPTLAAGTLAVAQAMADSDAVTIIGGGDSAAAVEQMGLGDKMTHISTGGGASLEYLEGKVLPGVACLDEKL